MVPFAGLLAALEAIPDPRRRQGRRYALSHLLLFSVLAVLAGATSYRGMLVFITVHRERLNAVFGTTLRRAPAVNTMRALVQALAPAELEAVFRKQARELSDAAPATGPRAVALDGKTLKRSFGRLHDRAGCGARAERLRLRGRLDPGAPGGPRCTRRDPGRASPGRGARRAGRAVHRRRAALPGKAS